MLFTITMGTARTGHRLFQKYALTNLLLRALRTRRGLKWGVPAMLLGVVYLFAAVFCTILINHGATGWLYLAVLLGIFDGIKLLLFGPVSLILLARTKHREARSPAQPSSYPAHV